MTTRTIGCAVLALLVAGTVDAAAQDGASASAERWPVFFEATFGWTSVHTDGVYRGSDSGPFLDATVGWRVGSVASQPFVIAASAGVHGAGSYDLLCVASSSGGCVPHVPDFSVFSALAGLETDDAAVRLLGGPVFVHADDDTAGLQARADLFVPIAGPVSIALAGRAVYVPDYRDDPFRMFAFAAGLRLR